MLSYFLRLTSTERSRNKGDSESALLEQIRGKSRVETRKQIQTFDIRRLLLLRLKG